MEVSVKSDPIKNPKKAPNLVFLHAKPNMKDVMEEFQTCFNMKERKCYTESVWQMQKCNCFPTAQGWIFMISQYKSCSLFDFFNKKSIQLPSINDEGSRMHDRCECLITKDKGNYVVMFVNFKHRCIYFLDDVRRSSKKNWIEYRYRDEEHADRRLRFVSTCNGQFYGASYTNVFRIDYKPEPKITTMEVLNISNELGCGYAETYMLEGDGGLYSVCKYLSGYMSRIVQAVAVWKRDVSLKVWNKVDSIGDQVFFLALRSTGAAWPATKIGAKGNLIYYVEQKDKMLYCYDMEAEKITVDVPCPRIRSRFCFPTWIFPVL